MSYLTVFEVKSLEDTIVNREGSSLPLLCPLTNAGPMRAWRRLSTACGQLETMAPWRPRSIVQVEVTVHCINCLVSFQTKK